MRFRWAGLPIATPANLISRGAFLVVGVDIDFG